MGDEEKTGKEDEQGKGKSSESEGSELEEILEGETFAPVEDFGEQAPTDDEKKGAEDDSSKSSDDTSDDAAEGEGGGKKEGDDSEGKSSDESAESGKEGEDEKDGKDSKKDGDTKPPETVPYSRFAEVVKDRNETREKLGELSGRLSAVEKDKTAEAEKQQEEEESADDDEPFQGTNKEFRAAVKEEAGKVAASQNAELETSVSKLTLRMSQKEAREQYADYDEIVTESGVLDNLYEMAEKGDKAAKQTIASILSDKNPAGRLYNFARDLQGKTPPRVDELDAEKWEHVAPVLKKLGLKTTEEQWKDRRKKSSGKKKDDDKGSDDSGGDETLRGAPGGKGPDGNADDDGDIDLEQAFPM